MKASSASGVCPIVMSTKGGFCAYNKNQVSTFRGNFYNDILKIIAEIYVTMQNQN
jgi:hypothetical protein